MKWGVHIYRLVMVLLLQVFLFNQMQISGYIQPAFFLFFVLMLPLKSSAALRLISAFVIGILVDMFTQTMGLHTAAVVLMAYVQHYLIPRMKISKDMDVSKSPSLKVVSLGWFAMYAAILIFIYHLAYFVLDAFSLPFVLRHFYRVFISSFATFIVVMAAYLINYRSVK
ncbi:MAG: rod shape-determining protein MreD [Bacteroidia bacterium]|nr:MAG: rod shape-determining protein MreD [Bacteroidia bacterium]